MSNKIDVYKIASELEETFISSSRKEIEEFINSLNGKTLSPNELLQELIAPLIGISSRTDKEFVIAVLQRVVDELTSSDRND